MKYSFATLALVTAATAQFLNGTMNGTYYTTEIVTALTTVCPSATELTHNGVTYTITAATTLTITDCPCTLTHAVVTTPEPSTVLYTSCPPSASAPSAPLKSIAPPPACPGGSDCPPPSNPLTAVYSTPTKGPVGTGSLTATTSSPLVTFTGAANANRAAGVLAGVGAIAVFAL